jgi:alkylhydroperoxidase AhpD family core domain
MERITFKDAQGAYNALKIGQDYVDSHVDPKLKKLIQFRVSLINSCAYCLDMHYKEAMHEGIDPIKLISVGVWRETPYYSEKEQAVLAFAEHLTHMPAEVSSDDIHNELNKHFTKEEIANLTLAIIQINSWNRLVRSFGPTPGKFKVAAKQQAAAEA